MTSAPLYSPDVLAACALQHYKSLPNHGKPREGQEWTVYAALLVVPSSIHHKPYVLCSATGSKCTTTGPDGWCLRDLHAEVLVKRGFQRLLWKEIQSGDFTLLYKLPSDQQSSPDDDAYGLKTDVELHLYSSDSPCGDSTIYELKNGDMNFTGAKLIVRGGNESSLSCCDNATTVTREDVQQLGQLRIKSGRSNLPNHLRSTSLSCSDKILKWTLLGLQGSRLPVRPVYLTSIIVSRDPHAKSKEVQQKALQRAILDRRNLVVQELKDNVDLSAAHLDFLSRLEQHELIVGVVGVVFDSAKSQLVLPFQSVPSIPSDHVNENGKRLMTTAADDDHVMPCKKTKVSPSGFCMNWQRHDGVEVLVGSRGTKQGKKCATDADYHKQASRLCRRELHILAEATIGGRGDLGLPSMALRQWRKNAVFDTRPLQGWVRSS